MQQLKIIPLGGCGEIGKNMTVVEQGDDIIVIDAGLSFPTEDMHGVDIVIPDITYLKENRKRIKGIVLTHGHEDHVGALAYIINDLKVPIYGSRLTIELAKRKLNERFPDKDLDLKVLKPEESFTLGSFEVEPIHVTHSLPDSYAIALWTQIGIVLFTGDFKFDFTPIDGKLTEMSRFGELGDEGVALLLSDSTNAESAGWSPSERVVTDGFRKVFANAQGRVLITTFASNIHRMQQAFNVAQEMGRMVAVAGRRMEQTIGIANSLKMIQLPEDTYIRLEDCDKFDDREIVILTTGSQGEPLAALNRMANEEYPRMKIRQGDTVVYSARPIPGNEAAIWQTVNRLFRQGAKVVYGRDANVHVSGHAYAEELKMMINLTRPHYIAPVHGEPRHQAAYSRLAQEMGYSEESIIVLDNGSQLVVEKDGAYMADRVPCGRVLVDSSGYAGVTDELLRDRRNLASDGVVFVNVAIDSDAGKIVGSPDLVTKGVMAPNGEIDRLKEVLDDLLRNLSRAELKDTAGVHQDVSDVTRKFLKKTMNKRPLVVASVVDV
ncbi:MAG: ribonuclease J [Armatimonadetes bacterium]|nr:ribonuclease J [Armatimonadota bacterium]